MKDKRDSIFIGWIKTIHWVIQPLTPIIIGKWYITFSIPKFVRHRQNVRYVISRTKRCFKCSIIVPVMQYGSYWGSQGVCCAKCDKMKEDYYDERISRAIKKEQT